MTLSQTLAALAGNASISITIVDATNVILITFMAPGYGALESDLDDKIVKRITVKSAKELMIELEADTP